MKRMFSMTALLAISAIGIAAGSPARADHDPIVLRAQSNPYLIDFFALLPKRPHLRVNLAKKGLDRAFSEWLREERSWVYDRMIREKGMADRR